MGDANWDGIRAAGVRAYKLWFSYGFGCMGSSPGKLIWRGYPKVVKRTFVTVADGWTASLGAFLYLRDTNHADTFSATLGSCEISKMGLPIPHAIFGAGSARGKKQVSIASSAVSSHLTRSGVNLSSFLFRSFVYGRSYSDSKLLTVEIAYKWHTQSFCGSLFARGFLLPIVSMKLLKSATSATWTWRFGGRQRELERLRIGGTELGRVWQPRETTIHCWSWWLEDLCHSRAPATT